MTLHQLRIFSSVSRYLNVTRAAASLHISQPSVSQQLKLLEDEFAVKLYEKVGQGIRLTQAGLKFIKKIEPILFQLDELEQSFKTIGREKNDSTLTIGASYASAETLLPEALALFREANPYVRVQVHTDRSALIEEAILHEQVEIGLFYNPSHHAPLSYISLGKDKIAFVASRSDPLVTKDEITFEELRNLPIVVQKPRAKGDIPTRILNHLRELNFSPNIVMQCETIHSVRVAVAGGAGIGFMIESTAGVQRHDLRLVSVKGCDSFYLDACVAHPKNTPLSGPANSFLKLILEVSTPIRRKQTKKKLMRAV